MRIRKIPKAKLTKLKKRAADQERRFKKMTPAQKRVTIAKDVILALNSKLIRAAQGTYVELPSPILRKREEIVNKQNKDGFYSDDERDLREVLLEQRNPSCSACALGAIFVSSVYRQDKATVEEAVDIGAYDIKEYMDGIFSEDQLTLIEHAFEKWELPRSFASGHNIYDASNWGDKFTTPHDRMVAIMENIIKNKGTFKLPKQP